MEVRGGLGNLDSGSDWGPSVPDPFSALTRWSTTLSRLLGGGLEALEMDCDRSTGLSRPRED